MNTILAIVVLLVVGYMLYKNRGVHPELFSLLEGEEIVEIIKGDYWKSLYLPNSQRSGEIAFTNKRILFQGTVLNSALDSVSVSYNEIVSIKKCFIALFLPFGIKIKTAENKTYILSVLKRGRYVELINSLAKKSSDDSQSA